MRNRNRNWSDEMMGTGPARTTPSAGAPAPMREGESSVDYIMREAGRRRVDPWQLPGLSYLSPPVIGPARQRATANPRDWLRALDEAQRAGRGSDPTNRLRNLVGRSPSYLPFSTNERAIWRWAWSGTPSPVNSAVWALRYMRVTAEAVARRQGASAAQTQAAGQAAVDQSGDYAVAENREANRQAMRNAHAVTQARVNRLQAQQRLIEAIAPQNAIPRAARQAMQSAQLTGSILRPLLIPAGIAAVGAAAFFFLTRR